MDGKPFQVKKKEDVFGQFPEVPCGLWKVDKSHTGGDSIFGVKTDIGYQFFPDSTNSRQSLSFFLCGVHLPRTLQE